MSEDDLKEFQVLPLSRLIWARRDLFAAKLTELYLGPSMSTREHGQFLVRKMPGLQICLAHQEPEPPMTIL